MTVRAKLSGRFHIQPARSFDRGGFSISEHHHMPAEIFYLRDYEPKQRDSREPVMTQPVTEPIRFEARQAERATEFVAPPCDCA